MFLLLGFLKKKTFASVQEPLQHKGSFIYIIQICQWNYQTVTVALLALNILGNFHQMGQTLFGPHRTR